MKKITLFLGLSTLSLMACQPEQAMRLESVSAQDSANFAPDLLQQQVHQQLAKQRELPGEVAVDGNKGADPPGVYLAYRYGYGLVMPSAAIKSTADKHMQICRDAGASKCQITGSNTQTHSKQNIRANLSLRAEPKWLESFVAQMKLDIADVKLSRRPLNYR